MTPTQVGNAAVLAVAALADIAASFTGAGERADVLALLTSLEVLDEARDAVLLTALRARTGGFLRCWL
jgi:hypothetical protein